MIGLFIAMFATIGPGTPAWLIALQAFAYGCSTSLQFTAINTMVYADLNEDDTSMGGSIASTLQQLSLSFGVAAGSLITAFFIPDRFHANSAQMISGIHRALVTLGAMTLFSTLVFRELRPHDGSSVSRHRENS